MRKSNAVEECAIVAGDEGGAGKEEENVMNWFVFSSRRGHTGDALVSWAQRCV